MFSVKTKIAACMFLLSMLAMAMVLLTVHQSSINALRTNEIHYNVEATNRTRYNFSYLFDSVYKTANLLIENAEISSVLREPPATGSADHTLIRNNLSTLLRTFIYPTQAISAVHIVGTEPGQFYSSIASANEEELRQVCATLLEQSSPQDRYLFTGMSSIEYYPGINRQTIQYVSPVYNTQTRLLMGYVVVDMDYSVLEEMFLTSSYCGYICCNAPDATTLLKSWHLLEENNLYKAFFDAINRVLVASGHIMKGGTIVDATIINAPSSNKNAEKGYAPEVHRTKMGNEWRLVMNAMLP